MQTIWGIRIWQTGGGRTALAGFVLLLALLAAAAIALGAAGVEPPQELWTKCPTGGAAGQCEIPRGIAADSRNGHLFVGDQNNKRVNEFNAAGEFLRAWGWNVVKEGPDDTLSSSFEICVPEEGDVCQKGASGTNAGQFSSTAPQGLAVDSAGDVYVVDRGNHRVQKFSPSGNFLAMFGGGVDQGGGSPAHPGDLCTAEYLANGDVCGAGSTGAGTGQFSASWVILGDYIAVGPGDKVYVGDVGRIQRFDTDGHWQEDIPLAGVKVQSLTTDSAGNLYYIDENKPGVHKISPAGAPLAPETFELINSEKKPSAPTAVAVDSGGDVYAFGPTSCCGALDNLNPIVEFNPAGEVIAAFGKGEFDGSTGLEANLCAGSEAPGNLYVTNSNQKNSFLRAYGTQPVGCFKARTLAAAPVAEHAATLNGTVNPSGLVVSECFFQYGTTLAYGQTAPCVPAAGELGTGSEPVPVTAAVGNLAAGTVYHFRLVARVGGERENGIDETFKTLGPPVITEEHAVSVALEEASLAALINPEGFATIYRFQYTTAAAFEAHGFEGAGETTITSVGSDRSTHVANADVKGLSPGTTYVWRLLAANSSGESSSSAHLLVTYSHPGTESCPNAAFRSGAAAQLPDCRAYEMVSPVDKNGGNIVTGNSGASNPGGYIEAAADGESLTYTATAAFGEVDNSFRLNQYLARRGAAGWASEGVHPPVSGQQVDATDIGFTREFQAFTPDLCQSWLIDYQTPPLTPDGQEGFRNLYRREDCGTQKGTLEALVPAPPALPAGADEHYVDFESIQGVSDDGRHAVFSAGAKLAPEAHEGSGRQVYDRFGGQNHLVSVTPGGTAALENAEVGGGRGGNLANAVSADGETIYWSAGRIFARVHPEQPQSAIAGGKCTEAARACTLPVSGPLAFFWGAARDGSKALYAEGNALYEFDLAKAEAGEAAQRQVAADVKGVAGMSEDLSRIYFVSEKALTGEAAGEGNSEGDFAVEGAPNLYLEEGGQTRFVASLSRKDVGEQEPGTFVLGYNLVSPSPYERATRVSASGGRIAFESVVPLTGFDNRASGGKAALEVFSYAAGSGKLSCVSCNPGGARPSSRELLEPYIHPWELSRLIKIQAAAWIPTWEHPLHASNALSADGQRLFFNSNDRLLPADTDGAPDVYEWEAPGAGGCSTAAASYFPQNDGCIYLISSGQSGFESEFWEASADGRDVFFSTEESLLPQDPGLIDLYDARAGGGFPRPTEAAECEGEACQSPPPPPQPKTPASSTFNGPANPPPARHCPKGKRKVRRAGKVRCVRKRGHRHHHRAHHHRRGSR